MMMNKESPNLNQIIVLASFPLVGLYEDCDALERALEFEGIFFSELWDGANRTEVMELVLEEEGA